MHDGGDGLCNPTHTTKRQQERFCFKGRAAPCRCCARSGDDTTRQALSTGFRHDRKVLNPRCCNASSQSAEAFRKAYEKARSPKIALYVNRELSSDVREWKSDVRISEGHGETKKKTKGAVTEKIVTAGADTLSVETRSDDGAGQARPDSWLWQLEDSFAQTMMAAGGRLVDRAMVMRLMAASSVDTAYEDVPVKKIETDALKGNADILVELVISRNPDPKQGDVYRTRAIDINSGVVLATSNTSGWRLSTDGPANEDPNERASDQLPDASSLGKRMAQELMGALAGSLK